MARSILGRLSVLAVLLAGVCASIGPHTDLTIANKVISPDGFSRDSVLADGTFPGPIISGNKVRSSSESNRLVYLTRFLNYNYRAIAFKSKFSTI